MDKMSGSFYDYFESFAVSFASDRPDLDLTALNPLTMYLEQASIPYDLMGREAFSYESRIGDAPLVKDKELYTRGWQGTYGLENNLYLADETWEEGNTLQANILELLDLRKQTQYGLLIPLPAVQFPK